MNAELTGWIVVVGVLLTLELLTGTFYMLMVAFGAAAGAFSAMTGSSLSVQLVWAAVVAAGTTVGWNLFRTSCSSQIPSSRNKDVNMDIGERVVVRTASADGRGTANYRGASWQVKTEGDAPLEVGEYIIREIVGSCLVLGKSNAQPAASSDASL